MAQKIRTSSYSCTEVPISGGGSSSTSASSTSSTSILSSWRRLKVMVRSLVKAGYERSQRWAPLVVVAVEVTAST